MKEQIDEAKKLRLSGRVKLLIIVLGAPMTFLFAVYGRLELALPLMNVIGVLSLVIFLKWKLRHATWFWMVMLIITVLHIPLLLFVPWTTKWVPALVIAVIDSADFFVILWILVIVGKIMDKERNR